jgi:hypothetical protein
MRCSSSVLYRRSICASRRKAARSASIASSNGGTARSDVSPLAGSSAAKLASHGNRYRPDALSRVLQGPNNSITHLALRRGSSIGRLHTCLERGHRGT